MATNGQANTAELVAMLKECDGLTARLALLPSGDEWLLHHGEVNLDDADEVVERVWRYADAAFLESRLPGKTVAGLLAGETQDIAGLRITAQGPLPPTAYTQRLRGQQDWGRVTTPWPRTEWTINRDSSVGQTGNDVLVGDGPTFLNFDQALSAFLYKRPHDNNAGRSDLWRIVQPHRDGWFPQITIGADLMTVVVEGEALDGAVLELSEPTGHQVQDVQSAGTYTFALPDGLAHDSLLALRRADQVLDLRSFPAPTYGRTRDASVVWEQPGAELEILLSGGESQHLECKGEVQTGDNKKKMLKTVAAFASKDGGTVLIGVTDELQIIGLREDQSIDDQVLQVVNTIRDCVEPPPPYTPRVIDHEGKKVLVIEVSAGGQMHAYRQQQRLEFFVRIGPNTVPARHFEVAAGFRQSQTAQQSLPWTR